MGLFVFKPHIKYISKSIFPIARYCLFVREIKSILENGAPLPFNSTKRLLRTKSNVLFVDFFAPVFFAQAIYFF